MDDTAQNVVNILKTFIDDYETLRTIYVEDRELTKQGENPNFLMSRIKTTEESEKFANDFLVDILYKLEELPIEVLPTIWKASMKGGAFSNALLRFASNVQEERLSVSQVPTLEQVTEKLSSARKMFEVARNLAPIEELQEQISITKPTRGRVNDDSWSLNVSELPRIKTVSHQTLRIFKDDVKIYDASTDKCSVRAALSKFEDFEDFKIKVELQGQTLSKFNFIYKGNSYRSEY